MEAHRTPWQPLYSIDRGGITELSVTGIVAAISGADADADLLIHEGDVDYTLWTRSLLKPFQLVSHVQILHDSYPALKAEHFALISSSHNCEEVHLHLLDEIMSIGKISADKLKCPAALPQDACTREQYKTEGKKALALYHNCSAKHFGYMLSLQAQGKPIDDYIDFENIEHRRVDKVLSELLHRPVDSFAKTTDGCQMPNHGLSVREMATLYQKLATATGELMTSDPDWASLPSIGSAELGLGFVGSLMHRFPHILGGKNRLDTKIMAGEFTTGSAHKFLAKDGADGLLAIAALPSAKYPSGSGMVIKLSSGYEIRHMEVLAYEALRLLGLYENEAKAGLAAVRTDHLHTRFSLCLKQSERINK